MMFEDLKPKGEEPQELICLAPTKQPSDSAEAVKLTYPEREHQNRGPWPHYPMRLNPPLEELKDQGTDQNEPGLGQTKTYGGCYFNRDESDDSK